MCLRALQPVIKKEVTHYLEPGHWFVSMYNDDGDLTMVTFSASVSQDMTVSCPNGCSGKGECMLGHCQCNPGFSGDDCSDSKWTNSIHLLRFRFIHYDYYVYFFRTPIVIP